MEKLAARMGVAKGTLYNYFADKESIVLLIRDRISELAALKLENAMEHNADTVALLRRCIVEMLQGMKEYHFLHVPLSEIVLRRTDSGNKGLGECGRKPRKVLAKLIRRGMDEGVLRPGDAEVMSAMLQSAVAGIDMGGYFDAVLDTGSEQVQDMLCEMILRGICVEGK